MRWTDHTLFFMLDGLEVDILHSIVHTFGTKSNPEFGQTKRTEYKRSAVCAVRHTVSQSASYVLMVTCVFAADPAVDILPTRKTHRTLFLPFTLAVYSEFAALT